MKQRRTPMDHFLRTQPAVRRQRGPSWSQKSAAGTCDAQHRTPAELRILAAWRRICWCTAPSAVVATTKACTCSFSPGLWRRSTTAATGLSCHEKSTFGLQCASSPGDRPHVGHKTPGTSRCGASPGRGLPITGTQPEALQFSDFQGTYHSGVPRGGTGQRRRPAA
jgi:hypothetical protein